MLPRHILLHGHRYVLKSALFGFGKSKLSKQEAMQYLKEHGKAPKGWQQVKDDRGQPDLITSDEAKKREKRDKSQAKRHEQSEQEARQPLPAGAIFDDKAAQEHFRSKGKPPAGWHKSWHPVTKQPLVMPDENVYREMRRRQQAPKQPAAPAPATPSRTAPRKEDLASPQELAARKKQRRDELLRQINDLEEQAKRESTPESNHRPAGDWTPAERKDTGTHERIRKLRNELSGL